MAELVLIDNEFANLFLISFFFELKDVTNASNRDIIGDGNLPSKRTSAARPSGRSLHLPIRCENPAKNNPRQYADEKVTIDTDLKTHIVTGT
eukprot:CAMPEP_0172500290 /NCGR_PEP_ID=MMETSP1066-20121228/136500_1 /TAXON_ID=671091 /ORGANISM="Coscinodiscus wailesii, Strain CCMP2513" /LENGTH=91 /DNA_ID=CAMNT_0013274443 /DNA_START=295 /DNA_END=567 /DNA_ORIENTATION=+